MAIRAVIRSIKPADRAPRGPVHPGTGFEASQSDLRALTFAILAFLVLTFILALGKNTPIFPWLYRNVPGFDMFQAPTRYTIWAVTGLAILAGIGIDGWRRPSGRGLYWTRLATAGCLAVVITAGVGWLLLDIERDSLFLGAAKAGFWGILLGILALRAPAREVKDPAGAWTWGVSLVVAADLILAGWGLNPAVPRDLYAGTSPTAAQIRSASGGGRLYLRAEDEYDLKFERFFRLDTTNPGEEWMNLRSVELPNINILDQLPHTANFDPLLPERYSVWMESLERAHGVERDLLLNLSGVSLVEIPDSDAPHGARFAPSPGGGRLRWFRCAVPAATGEDALRMIGSGSIALDQRLVVEGIEPITQPDCIGDQAEIKVLEDSANRVEVQVSTNADGWLFLADTWYPGWAASIDGASVPIFKADYLFRAVQVPGGDHRVEFHYNPPLFRIGLLITSAAVALLVALPVWRTSKARRS
jgi:hypothetical protein